MPIAELRLNRLFCQNPINICIEEDGHVECDVEKRMYRGDGRTVEIRVWAELDGVTRPGKRIEGPIAIAVILERCYFGIPVTSLSVIATILTIATSIPTILVPKLMVILSPV